MEFTPSSGGGSYEQPKAGRYTGILVGFAEIGTQTGGAYGPKKKITLRWELHKLKGPSMDSAGHIHTITARYNNTFNEKATLRDVIEKHIGPIGANQKVRSEDWMGKAAKLNLVASEDGKWMNVDSVSALDPEEDAMPTQIEASEHWEFRDGGSPPQWAKHFVEKSVEWQKLHGSPVGAASNGNGQRGPAANGDDDIPF